MSKSRFKLPTCNMETLMVVNLANDDVNGKNETLS